jgi:hypothetical protein
MPGNYGLILEPAAAAKVERQDPPFIGAAAGPVAIEERLRRESSVCYTAG